MKARHVLLIPVLSIQFHCLITSVAGADDTKPQLLADVIEIAFPKTEYEFTLAEAAKGIKIDYMIEIHKNLSGVVPLPQSTAGLANPTGLYPFELLSGNGQSYSLLDIGLGPPDSSYQKVDLKKQTLRCCFEWDGRNWEGPSDTDHPKGKPFPAGVYALEVSVAGELETPAGRMPFRIAKSVKVTLKP